MDSIEPCVILHLHLFEEDINNYRNNNNFSLNDPHTPSAYEGNDLTEGSYASFKPSPQLTELPPNFFEHPSISRGGEEIIVESPQEFVENPPFLVSLPIKDVHHIRIEEHKDIPQADPTEDENCSDVKFKLIKAMREFADANRRKEWPTSTSVHCMWDCSPFTGVPVAIPKWKIGETFFVYGCYCSYSCASAHLFFRGDITEEEKWDSYHLLHLLRKKILGISETQKIKLAYPQELLKKFGGHLSEQEFRDVTKETHNHHKVYKVLYPPIISIVPNIEEQTFNDTFNDPAQINSAISNMKYVAPKNENFHSMNRRGKDQPYIPIDQERIEKAKSNLKVKRNKPLLDKKNTLFNYMDIQID